MTWRYWRHRGGGSQRSLARHRDSVAALTLDDINLDASKAPSDSTRLEYLQGEIAAR